MRTLIAILALMMSSVAANAVWIHNKVEDPFQGDSHMAMGIDPEAAYGAGFRCIEGKDTELTLIFATPERMDTEHMAALSAVPIKILVIVDDQPKVEIDGSADTVGDANLLRFQSTDAAVADLVKATMAAKHRFALAAEIMGKIIHSHTFDMAGSKRAISQMVAACKLH